MDSYMQKNQTGLHPHTIYKNKHYIYTMEYYSAIKKNEILPFVKTWMNLEGIMLSEMSQRKTNTTISLICGI